MPISLKRAGAAGRPQAHFFNSLLKISVRQKPAGLLKRLVRQLL